MAAGVEAVAVDMEKSRLRGKAFSRDLAASVVDGMLEGRKRKE